MIQTFKNLSKILDKKQITFILLLIVGAFIVSLLEILSLSLAIPIVGLRKKSQVLDISKVLKWDLTKREFERLDNASRNCFKKMPSNPFSSL